MNNYFKAQQSSVPSTLNTLPKLIDDLKKTNDINEVWDIALQFFNAHGIEFVIYMYCRGYKNTKADTVFLTNMPDEWGDTYNKNHYAEVDPFFNHCCNGYENIKTGVEYSEAYDFMNEDEHEFIREAHAMTGFSAGVSITMRRKGIGADFGGWNLGTRLNKDKFNVVYDEHINALNLGATYIHEQLIIVMQKDKDEVISYTEQPLTKQQIACLQLLAQGKRTLSIADTLNIKPVTVEHHLKNAKERLKAKTREQAVARAVIKGLIH